MQAEAMRVETDAHRRTESAPPLRIRRLDEEELPAIEQHLLEFGWLDRHARFGAGTSDLAVAAYVLRMNPSCAILVGAVEEASGKIVGLAGAQLALAPGHVKMAVTVHPDHSSCGLGRRLLRQALSGAAAQGQEVAHFFFSADNRPILALVCSLGADMAATFDRAELRLDAFGPPTPPPFVLLLRQGGHGSVRRVVAHPGICETLAAKSGRCSGDDGPPTCTQSGVWRGVAPRRS
ncbi:GNAT family N-acetyltransferase [Belnapia sp. T18]|uniref:GNAT family N-acetyltransferase n=1 Tax=Belnapia arida TaxID=2804533 RepID=A0ABS1U3U0_9PROT|nr:GNAT family N-acetyltransferase [Belnapia arida]MBL6079215.1 GNAT family N-acetyltransferase [Belnapia arida]